jgi:hypothetical protein
MWETGGTGDLGSVDGHSPHTSNSTNKGTRSSSNAAAAFTELELIDLPAAMIPEHAACRLLRATPASAASGGVSGTVGGRVMMRGGDIQPSSISGNISPKSFM